MEQGLFYLDLESMELETIRENCESKHYRHLSISPDGLQLLTGRWDMQLEVVQAADDTIEVQQRIVLMNIDGTDEVILDLE